MVSHNVQAVLIMEKAGIPLFFMKLDPKAMNWSSVQNSFFTIHHDKRLNFNPVRGPL